jgi:O-antigen/teichoic acid export membrane protein
MEFAGRFADPLENRSRDFKGFGAIGNVAKGPITAIKGQLGNGFWALADQGVVSFGNFLTQIILARNLARSTYGVFTLLFGILLVLFTCQGGLITYPLSIEGATAGKTELRRLTYGSSILTLLLAIPLSVIVLGATLVLRTNSLAWAVLLAMVLWQLQETFRRALMAHLRHRDAVWGDALSYLGQAGVLWLLAHERALTLERAFLVLALTSTAATLFQSFQVGWALMSPRDIIAQAQRYWSIGRWVLLTSMNEAGLRQAFPWILAFLYSPAQAASYQSVINLLGVSHPILFSTNNLIIPAVAGARERGGIRAAWRASLLYGGIGGAFLVPYFCALLAWPHGFLRLVYGPLSPYAEFGMGLRLGALAYSVAYCAVVVAAFLYGLGHSKALFGASLRSTALALVPSALLILHYGEIGAIAGLLAVACLRLALNVVCARQVFGQEPLSSTTGDRSRFTGSPGLAERGEMAAAIQTKSGL